MSPRATIVGGLFVVLFAAAAGLAGCAGTRIDIYEYAPKPLPAGMHPLAAVNASLADLRIVSWSTAPRHYPVQRARAGADGRGFAATLLSVPGQATLYLSYLEIATHLRAVTLSEGIWTIHLHDGRRARDIQLHFASGRAVRLFLDGATALARPPRS